MEWLKEKRANGGQHGSHPLSSDAVLPVLCREKGLRMRKIYEIVAAKKINRPQPIGRKMDEAELDGERSRGRL